MKILLINNNPVVSRLTALSARKENIEIDEIQEVTELENNNYDIVFVDADSFSKDVKDIIGEHVKSKKSVIFYAEGDDEEKSSFDISILKPFLPSEVSAVIRSIEPNVEENLDLLTDKKEEGKSSDELFALDALDEKSFDDKLEEAFPLNLDDDLFDLTSDKKEESKEELKEGLLTTEFSEKTDLLENRLDLEEDFKEEVKKEVNKDTELFVLATGDNKKAETALEDELFTKDDKSTSELLDFEDNIDESDLLALDDVESKKETNDDLFVADEDFSKEVSTSTKVLDENEVENIKGLLSEDTDNELSLDELMVPAAMGLSSYENELDEDKKEKKKKSKKSKKLSSDNDSNVLIETLSSLPVENIRELLAGARVNINIKFPKSSK